MGPLDALKELRRDVDILKATGSTSPDLEFVQEIVLPMVGAPSGEPGPDPVDPPILSFGPEVWTLTNGTYGTVDSRGRTALVVGEGSIVSMTTFTAPLSITPGSDWTLRVLSTGEINEDYSAQIVQETGGGGLDMRVTESYGINPGSIRAGSAIAPNSMAFSPTVTEYVAVHEAGVTSVYIYGALGAVGSGPGASGAGSVTVIVPPGVSLFGLWVYDYAWEM